MASFEMKSTEHYCLPIYFSDVLNIGETIKTYDVLISDYVSEDPIVEHIKDGNNMILLRVHGFADHSLNVNIITNRGRPLSKKIDITVDETSDPYVYNNLVYRFFYNDMKDVFIVFESNSSTFLSFNNEYTIAVDPLIKGLTKTLFNTRYSFWFTSQYCPLFTTPMRIKLLGGPILESFTDDTIYRAIHKNSLEVLSMLSGGRYINPDNITVCDSSSVPAEAVKYVECKTAFDLLGLMDALSMGGSAQMKQLGDMTIQYGGSGSGNKKLDAPSPKKGLYDCFMSAMNALGGIKWAVRGLYDVSKGYPHPVMDITSNRTINTFDTQNANPSGPWLRSSGTIPNRII